MKVILSENNMVKKMLGDQKVTAGVYCPSLFNFIVEDKEILLFNNFTRMLSIIDRQEHETLLQEKVVVSSENEISPELRYLIEKRFLVPEGTDEAEIYRNLYELINMMRGEREISAYTILTTTACNARCFYCFEADFKPVTMTSQTANDLADYIIRNNKKKSVRLHWFGGEPLCNQNAINIICDKLRENGFTFGASVTSNGLLFNYETAKKAKEKWNVDIVQITMDGMPDEHNRRKNYAVPCENPFKTTIENVHHLLDLGITVKIRLNFDTMNIDSIYELIDYLKDEFRDYSNFVVYPAFLFEDCAAWNPDRLPEEQEQLLQQLFAFRDYMEELKLYFPPSLSRDLKFERCGSNNKAHRDVTPDGKFTVCHNVGDTDIHGSIYTGIEDKEKFDRWTNNTRILEKCRKCCWLPECTCFDQCPIKRSTCREDEQDIMRRKLLRAYRKYLRNQAENES